MVKAKLAGIPVQMNNRFPELEELCRDYRTDEAPWITLSVTREEIEEERAKQADVFTDGYLESICLYRKLSLEMLRHNVFLLHASVLEVDGEGYGFLAHSGIGKTTQTRLWLEYFADRARVVNGDKPLIRMITDGNSREFVAYGTPWCGKEGMGSNISAPLKALFLLERAEEPSCETAPEEYVVDRIFQQLLMPEDPDQMMRLLSMVDRLVETVPTYKLRCNRRAESVEAAYTAAGGR